MAKRESMPRGGNMQKIDFEGMIDGGNDAKKFCAQTANGTAHWKGTGWNKDWDWQRPELEPDATRPKGRSNRTGE